MTGRSENWWPDGKPAAELSFADLLNSVAGGGRKRHRRLKSTMDGLGTAVVHDQEDMLSWPEDDDSPEDRDASIVRPYSWTKGRTKSTLDLRVETMVSTKDGERGITESEYQSVAVLCFEPRSVAEVATLLGAPLGVAKVLLADMAQLGLVTVHNTAVGGADKAHLALMERVLSGLRRL